MGLISVDSRKVTATTWSTVHGVVGGSCMHGGRVVQAARWDWNPGEMGVHLHCPSDQFVQAGGLVHDVSKCGCAAYHPVGCKL